MTSVDYMLVELGILRNSRKEIDKMKIRSNQNSQNQSVLEPNELVSAYTVKCENGKFSDVWYDKENKCWVIYNYNSETDLTDSQVIS